MKQPNSGKRRARPRIEESASGTCGSLPPSHRIVASSASDGHAVRAVVRELGLAERHLSHGWQRRRPRSARFPIRDQPAMILVVYGPPDSIRATIGRAAVVNPNRSGRECIAEGAHHVRDGSLFVKARDYDRDGKAT